MSIKLEWWDRIRTLKSNDSRTQITVYASEVNSARYLTSELVIKNLNLNDLETELVKPWSILWSVLRWVLKEVNEELVIPIDRNKLTSLINKLEKRQDISEKEKHTLKALFNYWPYIRLLQNILSEHIDFKDSIWDIDKLDFNYLRKIVLSLLD